MPYVFMFSFARFRAELNNRSLGIAFLGCRYNKLHTSLSQQFHLHSLEIQNELELGS